MRQNNVSGQMVGALMLALVGGQAVHWLITPAQHPGASDVRTVGVVVQALVGWGGFAWLASRERRQRRAAKQPLP